MESDRITTIFENQTSYTSKIITNEVYGCFYNSMVQMVFSQSDLGSVYYDISQFHTYTISVENRSETTITAYPACSPNGILFDYETKSGDQSILPGKFVVFPGVIFIRYAAMYINAPKNSEVVVYFQGQYFKD